MGIAEYLKGLINKQRQRSKKIIYRYLYPHRGDYTLTNNEIIFAAVSRLSNTLSCIPVRLYKGSTPEDEDYRSELIRNCPNGKISSHSFFKAWETSRDTAGNGYVLKVVNELEQVLRLELLDPSRVTPFIDEETEDLWYKIDMPKGSFYIHNFYIMHTRFCSVDGITGVNPIKVLSNTLDYSEKIQQLNVKQIEKGINTAIVLNSPANLGEDQRQETIKAFIDTYHESGGNVILLESGLTATSMNMSPVDTKLLEVEKINREKVATVYNIPPHLLGDYSTSAFSSAEQQMLEFINLTMLPIVTMYEQELNRCLLTEKERKEGYKFRFEMRELLRGDTKTRAEADFKALRSAKYTPNEIRAGEDLPPTEDGDALLVSKDLIPLSLLIKQIENQLKEVDSDGE